MSSAWHGRPTPFVLALDVGTSSCRASLYDAGGNRVPGATAQLTYSPRVTPDGGAELDPDHLVDLVAEAVDRVAGQVGPLFHEVRAVATSAFWCSLVGVDRQGRATTPLYLWMDARSRREAELLKRELDERAVHARTGCFLHWSFPPAKLLWLSRAAPDAFRAARVWMSFGEYLMLRLFGRTFASMSMASASGLFNHHTVDWDDEVLAALPIEREHLPPLGEMHDAFAGLTPPYAARWPALAEVPWVPPAGDGGCSNLGAGCAVRQRFALMIGTSGAIRSLFRADAIAIPWGVWCFRVDRRRFLLGGSLNDGGSLVAWLRQTLQLPDPEALERQLAAMEPLAHGLTVLPFWAGERTPGWAPDARGAIAGLRLHTSAVDIVRAALEAVALRFAAIDAVMRQAVPEVQETVATGGALLRSPAWLQIVADALGRPVLASAEPEASSRGAALLALELLGLVPGGVEQLDPPVSTTYDPIPEHTARYRQAAEEQARLYEVLVRGREG